MNRKKNKVTPLGYHDNINQSASPQPKPDEKQDKLEKSSWNRFTTFVSQFVCTEKGAANKVIHSQEKVISMYGELDESDHQSPPSSLQTKPKYPHHRPEFKEVVFTSAPEKQASEQISDISETTTPSEAKLTIPTSELPKPNECKKTKELEQRTNAEILQDLSANGLVGEALQPSVPLENIKPGGVSFEIHVTTVRPKTAKGQRVPKPPRRLESLEVKADMKRQRTIEEISSNIKMKQEKAKLKRQALQETRQQMWQEKSQKISEMKKTNIVAKMVEKEERTDVTPQEQQEVQGQDITNQSAEIDIVSNELSQVLHIETSPIDDEYLDKISTYNGSDESDEENTDYLKSIKGDDKYDEFFDGPNQETFMF